MRKISPFLPSGLAATLCLCALLAQSQGDWSVGIGAHQVNPTSDNGTLAGGTLPLRIGSDIKPTVTFEYFVHQDLGIEVLAALPFKHDIAVKGVGTVGSTRQLPPVVSLQYHFNSAGKLSPFVGAGLNLHHLLQRAHQRRTGRHQAHAGGFLGPGRARRC
ncbi:outer membrane protein [Xanthomonas translucens pv. poae]|uniref:Outer membrane protein n=1 Tax=Xanthomonas graminis pv. poae TaxID=227946 RepID=A0A0K2ZE13_9XANT|nr:outer membrane protein [Xanthomonas translucens pv. poae]